MDAATALVNLSLNQANEPTNLSPLKQVLSHHYFIYSRIKIWAWLMKHSQSCYFSWGSKWNWSIVIHQNSGRNHNKWTPKNKECAVSVLLELGLNNSSLILAALQFGVYEPLRQIIITGTNRAQRKANSLFHQMSKCEHIPWTSSNGSKFVSLCLLTLFAL